MNKALLACALSFGLLAACASSNTQSLQEKKGDIFLGAGTDALMNGRYTEALGSLQEAVKLMPDSPNAWNNLGLAYAGKGELGRAEESWKKALSVDNKWSDARANLGALYVKQKKFTQAEKELKEVLKDLVYVNTAQVHYNLSLIYGETRKRVQEEQQLRLAVQVNDGFCPAWFRLGLIEKERGQYDQAATSFANSVKGICFKNPQAHYEISTLYIKAKDNARAKSKLLEIIQLFPQSDWARKAEITLNMIR